MGQRLTKLRYALFGGIWGVMSWCNSVAAAPPVNILVMIQPQRYFVEQIGGSRVAVTVLVPPGSDPHTYEPKPQTMVHASQAQLYIAMGIPEEQAWLPRLLALQPALRVIHQDQGISKIAMEGHHHHGAEATRPERPLPHQPAARSEGPAEEKSPQPQETESASAPHSEQAGLDPHIWLSPKLARVQAETIARGLCAIDPDGTGAYQAGLLALQHKIDQLDRRLQAVFAPLRGPKTFLVVHPSWEYFARDYGLKQLPLEVEGKEPTARELAHLIELTKREPIPVLLIEPQFPRRLGDVLARQTGVELFEADPLALDWENNLWQVGEHLAAAFSKSRPQP